MHWAVIAPAILGIGGVAANMPLSAERVPGMIAQSPDPTPTYDPLATPVLPEHPTQVDIGHHLYYYNCMPCHGDRGQGLTDEWRQVWEEDHRNCWGRGCHAGRSGDEGFPIPTVIPAVILDHGALGRYASPEDLYVYLETTHPPQEPGRLAEDEYRALVAYLWIANGKEAAEAALMPASVDSETSLTRGRNLALAGCLGGAMVFLMWGVSRLLNRR